MRKLGLVVLLGALLAMMVPVAALAQEEPAPAGPKPLELLGLGYTVIQPISAKDDAGVGLDAYGALDIPLKLLPVQVPADMANTPADLIQYWLANMTVDVLIAGKIELGISLPVYSTDPNRLLLGRLGILRSTDGYFAWFLNASAIAPSTLLGLSRTTLLPGAEADRLSFGVVPGGRSGTTVMLVYTADLPP